MTTKDFLSKKLLPTPNEDKAQETPTPPAGSKAEFMNVSVPSSQGDVGKEKFYQEQEMPSQQKAETKTPDLSQIKIAKDVEKPDIYERIAQVTDPNRPLSPQEQEKLARRRKSDAIFAALGDGITALSNVYFASEGANDMSVDPSQSLSAKSKARWDKIKAERDAKDLRFYEGVERRRRERQEREDKLKLTPYQQAMMDWRDRNAQSQDTYRQSEIERKAAADKARAEEQKRVNDARIANYNSQIYQRATKSNNTNRYYTVPIRLSDDEMVDVDARVLKDRSVVNKLFNFLPEADRVAAGSKDSKGNYKSPTIDEMMRAIFDALPNNVAMQEYMRQLAESNSGATSFAGTVISTGGGKKTAKTKAYGRKSNENFY